MNSPLILTQRDLNKYPHLKEKVQDETQEKVITPKYYKSMMEYREKFHTLLAGVIGTAIGTVITIVVMVI
jgi:hypothetical protein